VRATAAKWPYAAVDDTAGGWWPPEGRLVAPPCQCADRGCPCRGRCCRRATTTLFRTDTDDRTGTPLCDGCAADAWESGLYNDEGGDRQGQPLSPLRGEEVGLPTNHRTGATHYPHNG
jgi:hypothetical protein